MRIAGVGTGNIGRTIGGAWERAGHEVVYTSRTPSPPETVAITDALLEAQVVLLAIPGGGVESFLVDHGSGLAGRLGFDATNRIGDPALQRRGVRRPRARGAARTRVQQRRLGGHGRP